MKRETIKEDDQTMGIESEFFNSITFIEMSPHRLAFKVGVIIILLQNLDVDSDLYNGTPLIIQHLAHHLIMAKIFGGTHVMIFWNILRITMSSIGHHWPFMLLRRQFSL